MNIGSIKRNDRGTLIGRIATLQFTATIALRDLNSSNERAPKFEIFALSAAREWVQIGAFFELTSNSTGESFLNGKLEDPSFEKPLYISAFRQPDGSYNIAWRRPKDRGPDVDRAMAPRSGDDVPPLPGEEGAEPAGDPASQGDNTGTGGLGDSTSVHPFGTGTSEPLTPPASSDPVTPPASPKRGRKPSDPAPADA